MAPKSTLQDGYRKYDEFWVLHRKRGKEGERYVVKVEIKTCINTSAATYVSESDSLDPGLCSVSFWNSSSTVSSSCYKCWQQIHWGSLVSFVISELLRVCVSLLPTMTANSLLLNQGCPIRQDSKVTVRAQYQHSSLLENTQLALFVSNTRAYGWL